MTVAVAPPAFVIDTERINPTFTLVGLPLTEQAIDAPQQEILSILKELGIRSCDLTKPADLLPIVQYMTFEYHFSNLAKGVLDTRNIIYYLSVVAVFLHIAVFRLELRRLA